MNLKRAFTLVEILVVIVIIGILVTLVTLAVAGAQRSAKRARIAMEMSQITMALEQYKNEFGEYPPDMFDDEALVRHVKKRFPRFNVAGANTAQQAESIRQAITNVYRNQGVYSQNLIRQWRLASSDAPLFLTTDEANIQSLVLWLGGFVQPATDGKTAGFDADSEAPFGRKQDGSVNDGAGLYVDVTTGTFDKKTFLEMEVGKNICFPSPTNGQAFPCFVSRLNSDTFVPILYFRGRSGGGKKAYLGTKGTTGEGLDSYNFYVFGGTPSNFAAYSYWGNLGTAAAYAKKGNTINDPNLEWIEPEKYQLIHPGLDGKFGPIINGGKIGESSPPTFRSLENLHQEDRDNITNFSDFKEIQSILP